MDPDTAWDQITSSVYPLDERADSAAALVDWIGAGGCLPADLPLPIVINRCAVTLSEAWQHR